MQRSQKRNSRPSYNRSSSQPSSSRTTGSYQSRPSSSAARSGSPTASRRTTSTVSSRSYPNRSYSNTGTNRTYPQNARRSTGSSRNHYLSSANDFFAQIGNFCRKNRRILIPAGGALALVLLVVLIVTLAIPGDRKNQTPDSVQVLNATQTPAPTAEATPAPAVEATSAPEPAATAVPGAPDPNAASAPRPTMVTEYQLMVEKNTTDIPLGLVESARVDDSYFNDTLFIGDSVSKKLEYYIAAQRKTNPNLLGNAKFLTAQSFSARNALREVTENSIHPTIGGKKMKLEDAIATINPKRVYIMLGMNDVGVSGVENAVKNMLTLLKAIKDKCPNVQIFVQSATPRLSGSRPTTAQLFKYNVYLYEACKQMKLTDYDIWFVDVAHIMRDGEGKLIKSYCGDPDGMALHFTNEGCRVWVDYLYTHALPDA